MTCCIDHDAENAIPLFLCVACNRETLTSKSIVKHSTWLTSFAQRSKESRRQNRQSTFDSRAAFAFGAFAQSLIILLATSHAFRREMSAVGLAVQTHLKVCR